MSGSRKMEFDMNRSSFVGVLICAALLFAGCHEVEKPAVTENPVVTEKPDANESGPTVFPKQIAGTWQARDNDWRIILDPNGTVAAARVPLGKVWVRPNKTTKVEMKDGGWSTYKCGDCVVKYDPLKRELYVMIEVADIDIKYFTERIHGNSTDRFIGPVTDDGQKWTADWITQFDYGPRFPQDPNDLFGGTLIFDKVEKEPGDPNLPAK